MVGGSTDDGGSEEVEDTDDVLASLVRTGSGRSTATSLWKLTALGFKRLY